MPGRNSNMMAAKNDRPTDSDVFFTGREKTSLREKNFR